MKNHDVTGRLKTKCDDYCFKNAIGSAGKIEQAETTYNPIPQVEKYLKKIGLQVETKLSVSSIPDIEIGLYDDEYFYSLTDAYLDKLVSAVGYKILFLTESEFSNKHDLLTDKELDMHFNLQYEEIDDVVSLFSSFGILSETTYDIIEKISTKLPTELVFAYSLIIQSEVSYNKHMAEAFEWIGDESSVSYFKKMAAVAENMEGIETVFNDFFPDIKLDRLPQEKIPAFHKNCLEKITKLSSDLRDKIIAGLKKNTVGELISDVPF